MNSQIDKRLFLAIPVIAAIALMPFATESVFAQDANTDVLSDRIPVATTDALSDVRPDVAPDRRAEVMFEGVTTGYAIIGGQAYPSEIKISGNAVHQGHGVWKVKAEAAISVEGREDPALLELKGKAAHGKLRLHGTGSLGDEPFRIFLRAHFAPVAEQPGDFVLAFSAAKIHNMENGLRIPLIQYGIVEVSPVDATTDDYERFLDEFDVEP